MKMNCFLTKDKNHGTAWSDTGLIDFTPLFLRSSHYGLSRYVPSIQINLPAASPRRDKPIDKSE
jgi:hypothetical protein